MSDVKERFPHKIPASEKDNIASLLIVSTENATYVLFHSSKVGSKRLPSELNCKRFCFHFEC